jgi:phage terminase large subunit
LFVDKNSLNLIRELKRYKWMEDKDGNAVRKPVDFMNHLMDCFYILQWYHKNVVVQPLKTFSRMAERKPIRKDFR